MIYFHVAFIRGITEELKQRGKFIFKSSLLGLILMSIKDLLQFALLLKGEI